MAKKQRTKQSTEKTEAQLKQEEHQKKQWEMHKQVMAAEPSVCRVCDGIYFQQVFQIKNVNIAEAGNKDKPNMRHVPVPAWQCVKCDELIDSPVGLK